MWDNPDMSYSSRFLMGILLLVALAGACPGATAGLVKSSTLFPDGGTSPLAPVGTTLPSGALGVRFQVGGEGADQMKLRLAGLEEGFSPVPAGGVREYTCLPPGSYRLEALGVEPGGYVVLASFRVPGVPFWANPLVLLFLLGGVAVVIFLPFHILRRRFEARIKELEQSFLTASHELAHKTVLLERLAAYDEVSGLYNRRYFLALLQREMRRLTRGRGGECLAVVHLGVPEVTALQDEHGNAALTAMAQQVARCLRSTLRTTDLYGRLGEGSFAVVLPQTGEEGARQALTKVELTLRSYPPSLDGKPLAASLRIGVTVLVAPLTVEEGDAERLLHRLARGESVLTIPLGSGRRSDDSR